jgi:hypothetical protein
VDYVQDRTEPALEVASDLHEMTFASQPANTPVAVKV